MPLQSLIQNFLQAARNASGAGNPGPEEVHDIRVAIRRLDQGLKILGDCLPSKRVRRVRKRLKGTLQAAGEVRDRDIALKLIHEFSLDADGGVRGQLERQRNAASSRLVKALPRDPAQTLEIDGDSRLGPLPGRAVAILPKLAEEFILEGSHLSRHPNSKRRLHALRASAKRLRYTLEFFAECYDAGLEKRIDEIRKLQNALGDIQDCVAARRLLREEGLPRGVLKPLRREEANRIQKFQELWPKLFRESAAKEWKRYLKKPSYNGACRPRSKP